MAVKELDLTALLPETGAGRPCLSWIDPEGKAQGHAGFEDGTRLRMESGRLLVDPAPGRQAIEWPLGDEGHVVLTYDLVDGAPFEPLFREILRLSSANRQLESDLASMAARSAFLLEEWALVSETLPRLSTGETESEIVEMALCRLATAAGVKRALFVESDADQALGFVRGHVTVEPNAREPRPSPYPKEPVLDASKGLFSRALAYGEEEGMHSLADVGAHGDPEGPEALASGAVIAVPVRYGSGPDTHTLGVLMAMERNVRGSFQGNTELDNEERVLTANVASMLGAVLGVRQAARLRHELETANQIQMVLRPQQAGRVAGFDLAGDCRPCGEVGGDYLDYLPMAGGGLLAVVADVSGHNLASGMVMVSARAALRLLASRHPQVGPVFNELACALHEDLTRTERFITAAALCLRPADHTVTVANAGHNDVLLYRAASDCIEHLPSRDPVFGFVSGVSYGERQVSLAPGDVLVVYTDGFTEAVNKASEMFGEDRLDKTLRSVARLDAHSILQGLFTSVQEFTGRKTCDDDVTALVVKAVPIVGDRSQLPHPLTQHHRHKELP